MNERRIPLFLFKKYDIIKNRKKEMLYENKRLRNEYDWKKTRE